MTTTNTEKLETFFPNQRKKMLLKAAGTGPLMGSDKQRRIRLSLRMDLSDGVFTGMPDYVYQAYEVLAKENSVIDHPKVLVQLDGVNVALYTTEKTKTASLKVSGCMLHGFEMVREKAKKDGEVPPISLYLTLKTNGWIPELWLWLGDNLNAEFWMQFQGQQMSLSYVGPANTDAEEEGQAEEAAEEKAADDEEGDPRLVEMKPRNKMSHKQREAADQLKAEGLGGRVN